MFCWQQSYIILDNEQGHLEMKHKWNADDKMNIVKTMKVAYIKIIVHNKLHNGFMLHVVATAMQA